MDWTQIGTVVAVILTLMVYSYLVGDNPLFKLAEYILVGVSVGFATVTVLFNVFAPAINNIRTAASNGDASVLVLYLVPVVAGILLLFRPLPAARPITNLIVALVIGIVAALSFGGTLAGTLLPQIGATMLPINRNNNGGAQSADLLAIIGNVVLVAAAVLTLWYFQFTLRKNSTQSNRGATGALQQVRVLGRWTLMLALGAVFASVFLTYLAALIDRLSFLFNVVKP